jgi:cytochrome bd ubiquinol oxidase subunit II
MEALWFVLVGFMIVGYVVLDGFDLGAGTIYFIAAKTDDERRMILSAIGPVWDGNEVWLLAAGGTLYFAFPMLYASSFSGFYLPLMMVLWLLILRGIGIELRSHGKNPMWRAFFDFIFSGSSALLAIFFGAALGNVIRGVPLNGEHYFFEPFWTDFTVSNNPGILDWYTILTGLLALVTLASHGALYVATKTEGEILTRARRIASLSWWAIAALSILGLAATLRVRPQVLDNYRATIAGVAFPMLVTAALFGMFYFRAKGNDKAAFLSSCAYIVGMLGGVAYATYPVLLPSTTDPAYAITVHNAAAPSYGLKVGVVWWSIGMAIAIGYFIYLYRSFKGKVSLEGEGHG